MTITINIDLSDTANPALVKMLNNAASSLGLKSPEEALIYSIRLIQIAAEAANQGKTMGVVSTNFNLVAADLVVKPAPNGNYTIGQLTGSNFDVSRLPGAKIKP